MTNYMILIKRKDVMIVIECTHLTPSKILSLNYCTEFILMFHLSSKNKTKQNKPKKNHSA